MFTDLGSGTRGDENQVCPRMNRGQLGNHHLPPDPDCRQLAALVYDRVVTEGGKCDPNNQATRIELTTSP